MKQRIGAFFFIVGIVLIFIFWGPVDASQPIFQWLFIGLLLIVWGVVLISRGREKSESQRFRTLRKLRGKKKNDIPEG